MSDKIQRGQQRWHHRCNFTRNRSQLQEYTECVICFDDAGKIPPDYYAAESSCMSYAWGNGLPPQEGQVLFALTVTTNSP